MTPEPPQGAAERFDDEDEDEILVGAPPGDIETDNERNLGRI